MRIWCLNDKGGWGSELALEASYRGWDARLFGSWARNESARGDYAFMRLSQNAEKLIVDKRAAIAVLDNGLKVIPDALTLESYEDKWIQAMNYAPWMPETALIKSKGLAYLALQQLNYPFISKSRTGSASRNVRVINNAEDAEKEIECVFGSGIAAPHRLGELVQQGYLIWQEFLPFNDYDYRVVRTGRNMMVLQRHNKPGSWFASGSGINNPAPMCEETRDVLRFADEFFTQNATPWCGIDIVRDSHRSAWRVLETTLGWSQPAYSECPYYRVENGDVIGTIYKGADIWRVLCNEISAGVFG